MKSTSIKIILLSAFAMASPLLTLAGDRAVPPSGKDYAQDRSEIGRVLQQGKGSGMSLSIIRANASRVQTAEEKSVVKAQPVAPRSNLSDPAFTR